MFFNTSSKKIFLHFSSPLSKFCQLKQISLNRYVDAKSDAIAFCVKTYASGSFIKNRMNIHEMQNRLYTECGAVYVSRLRTKMYQNISVDFKLGYVDVKSDTIAFCVKTYASGSFIKNRMNIHEMQNRLYTECGAVYVSRLRTKMYQNISVDFKLGYVDVKSDTIAFCVKTYASGSFIKNRMNIHEMQNRLYTECDAVYVSKLRTKMYQNISVDFKLGYVDVKSDTIAFCV